MVAEPADTQFTIPVLAFTDAIDALLLLHTPPVVALDKVSVVPGQAWLLPVMVPAEGNAVTVTLVVVVADVPHTVIAVKVIVVVPATPDVTAPVAASIEATAILLLLHTP